MHYKIFTVSRNLPAPYRDALEMFSVPALVLSSLSPRVHKCLILSKYFYFGLLHCVTPYGFTGEYKHLIGTYCLHLQTCKFFPQRDSLLKWTISLQNNGITNQISKRYNRTRVSKPLVQRSGRSFRDILQLSRQTVLCCSKLLV